MTRNTSKYVIEPGMKITYKDQDGTKRAGVVEQIDDSSQFPVGKLLIRDDEDGKVRGVPIHIGW